LALVEQQVRHHGARIEVTDSPLGGARFSVRFVQIPRRPN
jgi:signal transduction histidine kinase